MSKLLYIDKTLADSKTWLGNDWNAATNTYYRSIVFTNDGHILTHGKTFVGINTTYKLSVNGTTNGDSTNGVSLGTIYAPTTAGTSGQLLKSTGSGAPDWLTISTSISNSSTDSQVPSALAVWNAIESSFQANNAMIYKGTYTAKATQDTVDTTKFSTSPGTQSQGWTWIVTGVSGDAKYFGNIEVENGDMIIANIDNPGTTIANYHIIQTNITGALTLGNFASYFTSNYADLDAIEALTGTSGFLKKTAANTWELGTAVTSITLIAGTGISLDTNNTAITSTGSRTISLKTATTSAIGGIIASNVLNSAVTLTSGNGSTADRYYGLQIDNTGKAFVNIPWVNTWRPVYAYTLTSNSLAERINSNTGTDYLQFGSEFVYTEGDTGGQSGVAEIHLAWAEVDSNGNITYAI